MSSNKTRRSWREGRFGRSPSPSGRRNMSRTGSVEKQQEPLLDPEQQRLIQEKHVRFAEGTISGSHLDMLPVRDGNSEEEEDDGRPSESTWGGEYIKSVVYGGLDAIVTCFALVASVSGGQYPSGSVLVLGCANLIADGISMGFGDYLSSTSEQTYAANRKEVSDWDFQNDMHAQVMNLVSVYESYGMDRSDAEQVVEIFSKYKNMLTTAKMTMEDGLLPPDEDESPLKNGLVTFFSFLAFGSTPLLSFAVLNPFTHSNHVKFLVACFATALALMLLGVAKAKISGGKYLSSVLVVLGNGGLAALAAYFISYGLEKLSGTD